MPEEKQQKIAKTKGRPMLHWVGKKPIDVVQSYPAQLIETVNGKVTTPSYDLLANNWQNLLFHGDNKEVLSTLIVNGFRGKVDLIYIDPPFDSGADYVRKVELRGSKNRVIGEEQSVLEQTQYTDIWANDNYLQFMYERLILMRELLSETGSIYLHCDWHKSHQLRFLMDEVFGSDNFRNDIAWHYGGRMMHIDSNFNRKHDNILFYTKTSKYNFKLPKDKIDFEAYAKARHEKIHVDELGNRYLLAPDAKMERTTRQYEDDIVNLGRASDDVWEIRYIRGNAHERTGYPTQKPEELLERIISSSSIEGDIILDCFVGSGTTSAVAQKLNRKWIGTDINKGAIQTTMKRLQSVIQTQTKTPQLESDSTLKCTSILHYRVNNYDFQKQHELKGIIIEKYDVTPTKTDNYFDGAVGEKLVKIADLNQPVNKLTIQGVLSELSNRPEETRNILIVGSGVELGVDEMVSTHNKTHAINKLEVRDIQSDGIIVYDPAEADISIKKDGNKVQIKINDYLSPTILKRLDLDRSIFGEKITDFRSQIDVVVIDTNYDGKTFNIVYSDVPEKKSDFVIGEYELELPKFSKKVAVKIIDMLGEETLVVE